MIGVISLDKLISNCSKFEKIELFS